MNKENIATSPMARATGLCFEDLKVGQIAIFSKTITEADLVLFAGVSGDTNPMHLDVEYAETTMFHTRIVHGLLTASFISTLVGTRLPGPGCIYVSQTLKFKAPVHVGDTVVARAEVTSLLPEKKFVIMRTQCLVRDKVVIDGEATVLVPTRDQ